MEVRQVFVSSENRDKNRFPYGNSYTLHLTQPIKDIHKVELLYASVPNVLYNLTEGTNVFSTNVAGAINVFSLQSGFYNASTLAAELTQTINSTTGITVEYIEPFGKFFFSSPSSDPAFAIQTTSEELSTMLGITTSAIGSQTSPAAVPPHVPLYADHSRYENKNWIQSTVIANLSPNEGVFLDIHELRTMFNEDALAITGNTYTGQNVSRTFGLIPMDVDAGTVKNFKKNSDYDFCVDYVNPIRKLDRITVEWVDRRGKLLNFNGLEDNSFMLRFHTLRKNL